MVDKEEIPCDVCGKFFDSKTAMKKHMDYYHNEAGNLEQIGPHKTRSQYASKKLIILATIGILIRSRRWLRCSFCYGIKFTFSNRANHRGHTV